METVAGATEAQLAAERLPPFAHAREPVAGTYLAAAAAVVAQVEHDVASFAMQADAQFPRRAVSCCVGEAFLERPQQRLGLLQRRAARVDHLAWLRYAVDRRNYFAFFILVLGWRWAFSGESRPSLPFDAYGDLWWIDRDAGAAWADSWGGQFMIVDARRRLVVVSRNDTGRSLLQLGLFALFDGDAWRSHHQTLHAFMVAASGDGW